MPGCSPAPGAALSTRTTFAVPTGTRSSTNCPPPGHRLHGIDPHSLRHAGMSLWLRANLPLKMIQKMGGWKSLKVMLDVYAAVLPDD